MKKYKLRAFTAQNIGFHYRTYKRPAEKQHKSTNLLGPAVRKFYIRDDNSKILPGKKQTITLKKDKGQKRILSGSLKNLHLKFTSENPSIKISYPLFCRLRPFWVKPPTNAEIETCVCKIHDNIELVTVTLHGLNVIKTQESR